MKLDAQELPHHIVGACLEVHQHLGMGLDAQVYKDCLAVELRQREIIFTRDTAAPILYKGQRVKPGLHCDFIIESSTLLTIHGADASLIFDHKQRLRNALRLTGYEIGLIINFNVENLRDGIKRIIVAEAPPALHYREVEIPAAR